MQIIKKYFISFLVLTSFCFASVESRDEEDWTFEESPLYSDEMDGAYDPLEPFNRVMFGMNYALDKLIISPLAVTYNNLLPRFLRSGIENFTSNFFSPLKFVNFVLQGDGEQAVKTVFRFILNTVFGFFGAFDAAQKFGLEKRDTSFGDTLKKWGAKPGPYLVLPIFGPTSFRGGIGRAISLPVDPIAEISLLNYKKNTRKRLYYAIYCTDLLAKRASILKFMKELEEISDDMYVTVRNVVMAQEK